MSNASTWGNGIAVGGIVFGLLGYAAAWWRFAGSPKARRLRLEADAKQWGDGYRDGWRDGDESGRADDRRARAHKAAETRKRNRANAGEKT